MDWLWRNRFRQSSAFGTWIPEIRQKIGPAYRQGSFIGSAPVAKDLRREANVMAERCCEVCLAREPKSVRQFVKAALLAV